VIAVTFRGLFLKTDFLSLEYLGEVSWLVEAVRSDERAAVESALGSCSVLSLPRASSLGADRFETVSLFLVEDGLVLVSASSRASARRIVVSLAGPGSVLLPPGADERLEALADARLTLVPSGAGRRLLEVPAAAVSIADGMRAALQDCRESLGQFASLRHTERVRLKLIQLARCHGKVGTDGLLLELPLTHELLADMVGSTRETVTRALAQLAHEGIVQHERGRYRIGVPPDAVGP
jgi:CRP/FNR family transcriptional regulator, cyclic AMP receptor protein